MKDTPFKMNGFSGFGNAPLKTHEAGHTSTDYTKAGMLGTPTYSEPAYEKKKKRKQKITDIKKGLKRYVKQVQGKVRPRGWCPKGGKCGGGPGVQRPSLARRLWPFASLRQGGTK
tara:strand:+ start:522 stop:866 length:345 start_codon:yes stop_codon:yes gene_type:complete